jgi:hypothetical protein
LGRLRLGGMEGWPMSSSAYWFITVRDFYTVGSVKGVKRDQLKGAKKMFCAT